MGKIPQDVIDRVLAQHDIVEVIGRTVPLKKMGRSWKALCPFHEEKTPSFTVNQERQTFKCFGCQKGGNVFGWLMERENLKFFEAVRALAAEKGIPVPTGPQRGDDGMDASRVEGIRAALALAQDLYVRTLWGPEGVEARAYLEKRGFPAPAVRAIGLGLSPNAWDGLLKAGATKGISPGILEDAGLAIRREKKEGSYDRFRARLMFPVSDVAGRLVTYGARALRPDDQPKYLNGPETPVFKKGRTLYALDKAKDGIRKSGCAVLMEGYTDVLMAHMHGFTSAVAGMGTAFTTEQAKAMSTYATKVVLLYDGDAAGRLAAEKSLDVLLDQGLEVRVALLPEGKDVDEVLLEEGVERLQAVLDGAKDLFEFKIVELAKTHDLTTERGRAFAAERLGDSVRRVKHPIERDLLFRRVAERLGVSESLLRRQAVDAAALETARRRRPGGETSGFATSAMNANTAKAPLHDRTRADDVRLEHECLVAGCVARPEYLAEIRTGLPLEEVSDPGLHAVYKAVLEVADTRGTPTMEALGKALAADPEGAAALAGLPEELNWEDRIPWFLRLRRQREATVKRQRAVLQLLVPSRVSPEDGPPGAPPVAR